MSRSFRKGVTGVAAVAVVLQGMLLSGCVTTQGSQDADAGDVCRPQREALEQSKSYFDDDVVKGAVVGGVLGLGVAVLTGNSSAAGLLVGTAGGAAVGAATGGFFAKLVKEQGADKALDSALGMTQREADNLAKTQTAMDALTQCRLAEVQAAKDDYRAKRISKAEAQDRLAAIRARMDKDHAIAQAINAKVDKRGGDFQVALVEVRKAGRGKKEKQFETETATVLTRGQGVKKSTEAMVAARAGANDVEDITLRPWHAPSFSFG